MIVGEVCVERRIRILVAVMAAALMPVAAAGAPLSAVLPGGVSVELDSDFEINAIAEVRDGDAWSRLALRLTGDAANWQRLAEINRMGPNLLRGARVRVPFLLLRGELQIAAVRALFPSDGPTGEGWLHLVRAGSAMDGEPLWKIAEWFAGDPRRYTDIRSANPNLGLSTRVGDRIVIPRAILAAPFLEASRTSGNRTPAPSVSQARPPGAASEEVLAASSGTGIDAGSDLTYGRTGGREYAIYRLKKGEALWSSVVVRFTGLVFARDVNDAVDRIVAENGIEDVARMQVGTRIRIPLDLLMPEYLPSTDHRRVEYERSVVESARAGRRVRARNLEGVHVILDPGHGGRDVGTVHGDLWESTHVYDVSVHLKQLLEQQTGARVWMTTRSRELAFNPSSRDRLVNRTDHAVLTTPNYDLEDAVVGVNLRWYLANAIYRRLIDSGVPPEKILFISMHADSLHPSLRGAMAYIPGNRYVTGTYRKSGDVYLARAEVRESPEVEQTQEEALRAEGLSRELATSIMHAFGKAELAVHPYKPVRDNVVRSGREWVPAVIRYNKVPTRLLLEICNLGNEEDRRLVATRTHRIATAAAIFSGIVDFYASRESHPGDVPILMTAAE